MASKKPRRTLRPRQPARVRKKKARRSRSHHHPELWGLGMVAVGLLLATVLWLGFDGGSAGSWVGDAVRDVLGAAAYLIPLALLGLGGLLLVRSALVDVKPFRTGLALSAAGLLVALGDAHGGAVGGVLGGTVARVVGETGAAIIGVALLVAGTLLVTGASTGALLRRTGHAVRRAGTAARQAIERPEWGWSDENASFPQLPPAAEPEPRRPAPVDGVADYPDVIGPPPSVAPEPSSPEPVEERETEDAVLTFGRPRTPSTACPTGGC
jgi:DNA segregation ATPase FtsK/SpoIIIE-like protein